MNGSHVTGGGAGALIGTVVVGVLKRYGVTLSDVDASVVGATALAAGAGLGHLISTVGILPALKVAIFGPPKPKPVVAPPAPVPAPVVPSGPAGP